MFLAFVVNQVGKTEITRWQYGKNGAVSLTYDDGSVNKFRIAVPIKDSFKFPATFFIITGSIPDQAMERQVGRNSKRKSDKPNLTLGLAIVLMHSNQHCPHRSKDIVCDVKGLARLAGYQQIRHMGVNRLFLWRSESSGLSGLDQRSHPLQAHALPIEDEQAKRRLWGNVI